MPELIVAKICVVVYGRDIYPCAKFVTIRLRFFSLTPNMQKCAPSDLASFLAGFFRGPIAKPPAPIFTISTSKDAISHKDVPFEGPEKETLHFDPILSYTAMHYNVGKLMLISHLLIVRG